MKSVRACVCVCVLACACQCLQQVKIDLQARGLHCKRVAVLGKYGRGLTLLGKLAEKMMSTFLCFQHVIEKEELKLHLQASKDAQRQLTAEVLKVSVYIHLDKCLE